MVRRGGRSVVVGLVTGVCAAAVIACGAARSTHAPATMPGAEAGTAAPGDDPRAQIDALDQQIDAELARMNLPPQVPACAAAGCGQIEPSPMSTAPVQGDPSCRPAASAQCTDVCTLSGSICTNADRICELATQLGGGDAYANEKCAKGKASCEQARTRCCGCS